MSHKAGTVQPVTPAIIIGPDSLAAPTMPNTWQQVLTPAAAPTGTRFVILHFTAASFPASNKLVVDLGWGESDEFTSADGASFWTRPIKLSVSGTVTIQYITNGSTSGGVTLGEYGRGEEVISGSPSVPETYNKANLDVFLLSGSYTEPFFETRGLCSTPPNWSNVDCLPNPDIRRTVARSCCVLVSVHPATAFVPAHVSTCSGTLIGADIVLTAGHCMSDPGGNEEASTSVCFDYQTTCGGAAPAGYSPRFFKVKKIIRRKHLADGSLDYCLMQIKAPASGIGIPPVAMRPSLPAVGDQVFQIHHPAGVVKKVSAANGSSWSTISRVGLSDYGPYIYVYANTDLTGGSSGSALFDATGKIVGVADIAGRCANGFLSTTEVLKDLATSFPATVNKDVMIVFDRSGSMVLDAGTGKTKIEEAKDAASLFVQLVAKNAGHRMGLVSFSTSASNPVDYAIGNFNVGARNALIGNSAPYSGGVVGGLTPGGYTTIGGGLDAARLQFPVAGTNQRTILLLTDGLQNTPPMIQALDASLSGIEVHAIGFGTEASLDGTLLTRLAQSHNGLYTRAGDPLNLKKFFAMAFGNIFETGTLMDPEYVLSAKQGEGDPVPYTVCSESTITIVMGWDKEESPLYIKIKAPSGQIITTGSPGIETSSGRTWTFIKIDLPYNGDRDGTWYAIASRYEGGEFPTPRIEQRYFINITCKGGPRLNLIPQPRKYYSGDSYLPLVQLVNEDGTVPHAARVKLVVHRPAKSLGNLLSKEKLIPATEIDADSIPSRYATLQKIEKDSGQPVMTYTEEIYPLYDDGEHHNGAMEPDGIFGDKFNDLLKAEGNYSFRAIASYGHECEGTRELSWSVHVDAGIDPRSTKITLEIIRTLSNGRKRVRVTVEPTDRFGNKLGPGRAGDFIVAGANGSEVMGTVKDNGEGTYTVSIDWDPTSGYEPGIVISQTDRPSVTIAEPCKGSKRPWWLLWLLIFIIIILLVLLMIRF